MNTFELDYRKFEPIPKIYKLSNTSNTTTEEVLGTLETAYTDLTWYHSIIEPTFQDHNGTNQHQHTHKITSQQYQHKHTSQQYQPISF